MASSAILTLLSFRKEVTEHCMPGLYASITNPSSSPSHYHGEKTALVGSQLVNGAPDIRFRNLLMRLPDDEQRLLSQDDGPSFDWIRGKNTPSFPWRGFQFEWRVTGDMEAAICCRPVSRRAVRDSRHVHSAHSNVTCTAASNHHLSSIMPTCASPSFPPLIPPTR
jgi:hypothetical protein